MLSLWQDNYLFEQEEWRCAFLFPPSMSWDEIAVVTEGYLDAE